MLPTRSSRVVVAALAVVAIACGNPTKPIATIPNTFSTFALYALTGAPANAATAISFLGGLARTDASFAFDVAFDVDTSGRALVYPVRAVAGGLAGSVSHVGLQVVPGTFEAVREVPATGYDTLSVQRVAPGTVLAVELLEATCAYSPVGQFFYGKLVVDSVKLAPRRLYARTVLDANCGYRQVMPDSVPTS
jgi:hypothetical protein